MTIIPDGANNFTGGQDASKLPDRIPNNSYASGINLTTSYGTLGPRWPFAKINLQFNDQFFTLPNLQKRSYRDIFLSGNFQACIPYSIAGNPYILYVVAGIVFLINPVTGDVLPLELPDGTTLDETSTRLNWEAADKYIVIHDFPNFPVIVQGSSIRRANPALFEVPISVMGTYNQNRLFIANNGLEFTAGDPTGNLATPEAPITFEEIEAPQAPYIGQIFALPSVVGSTKITAMTFLTLNDTSTGIGPLIVATPNVMFSFQSQIPRASWQNSQFGSCYVNDSGIVGQRAHVNVGADLFYLSADGFIRSANMSRSEQGRWSKAPISNEIKDWLKFQSPDLMQYTAFSYYGNKIFVTVNPYRVKALTQNKNLTFDYVHAGMCVMELDNVSTLTQSANPVWAGLWTGIRPMDFASVNQRMFVAAKDKGTENSLWEVRPDLTYDQADGQIRFIRSKIYTRQHVFGNPFQNKDIHSLDLGLTNLSGDIEIDVDYKPSQVEKFLPWRSLKRYAEWRACCVPKAKFLNGFQEKSYREIVLGTPNDLTDCDKTTGEQYGVFRKVQLAITIKARTWQLNEYRIKANEKAQAEIQTQCIDNNMVSSPAPCNTDWHIEEFGGCQQVKT